MATALRGSPICQRPHLGACGRQSDGAVGSRCMKLPGYGGCYDGPKGMNTFPQSHVACAALLSTHVGHHSSVLSRIPSSGARGGRRHTAERRPFCPEQEGAHWSKSDFHETSGHTSSCPHLSVTPRSLLAQTQALDDRRTGGAGRRRGASRFTLVAPEPLRLLLPRRWGRGGCPQESPNDHTWEVTIGAVNSQV